MQLYTNTLKMHGFFHAGKFKVSIFALRMLWLGSVSTCGAAVAMQQMGVDVSYACAVQGLSSQGLSHRTVRQLLSDVTGGC